MTSPFLLAAALADHEPVPGGARLLAAARAAEDAGLDLVTIEPGPADPLLVAARLAAQTTRIAIAPVVATTTTEPFHVSTALATIDVVAGGRAGWVLAVDDPDAVGGTVTWDVPRDATGDAAEHLDAVRAVWDRWEDGAVIRDAATDRFLDRSRVHHVDLRGTHLAVRGPSITPRPPQGNPPVLVRATDAATRELARRHGDVVLVRADEHGPTGGSATRGDAHEAVLAPPEDLVAAALTAGGPAVVVETAVEPATDPARLAARVAAHRDAGAGGVLLHARDLPRALDALLPALAAAGVAPADDPSGPPPRSLRERLGLPAAVNRYAAAR